MSEISLIEGEFHPAAHSAYVWLHQLMLERPEQFDMMREALNSTAISGNRLAELCLSTLERIDTGQPVSDRYLLGLCWTLRAFIDNDIADGEQIAPDPTEGDVEENEPE